MKKYTYMVLFIAMFFIIPIFSLADTHTAASCSLADVQTAYNAASAGDTVAIPSGTAAWADELEIDKEIILQGAGYTSTKITSSASNDLIWVNFASDTPLRITGIYFDKTGQSGDCVEIGGSRTGSFELSEVRIDHCKFEEGAAAIHVVGWVEGVIDNNVFLNCDMGVRFSGDNSSTWGRTIAAGTANAMFIEDNTFTLDNDYTGLTDGDLFYHQEGARSVIRYNTYDSTAFSDGDSTFFDTHGNQNYYSGSEDFRGQPIIEVYENNIYMHHTYRVFIIRGGSILIYNNTMTLESGSTVVFLLSDEESWQTLYFDPLDESWPAEDQIMNCFFWGNTLDGSPVTTVELNYEADAEFIVEDRDYFMHAPLAQGAGTDGIEAYTDRAGAAGNGADGTMTFTADVNNAYYPYGAYAYPHPLRGGRRLIGAKIEGVKIE